MKHTSVIGYVRVSTASQAKKGVSLEDQVEQEEKFATGHQLNVAHTFSDVRSASDEKAGREREGFNLACKLAHKNEWDVLVTMPSRFTRKIEEYDRFVAKGRRLICVSLGIDATNEQVRAALMVEIALNEQRQRSAVMGRKRAIEGGKLSKHTVPNWGRVKSITTRQENALRHYEKFEQQMAIALAGGAKGEKEVAKAFNKAGFKTAQKCPWKANNVRRVKETIATLRARGGLLSPGEVARVGNDNLEQTIASTTPAATLSSQSSGGVNVSQDGGSPSVPPQPDAALSGAELDLGYPLSPDELAQLRYLLALRDFSPNQIEQYIRAAANPELKLEECERYLAWIAKKMAA